MKILAINGSYRGDRGFTKVCIDKIFHGASAAGAECEAINLADMNIRQCIGCEVCHSEEHYKKCIYDDKDDVSLIFNKMREADLIIYATPVYIFTMSALLKRLFDRFNSAGDSSKFTLSEQGLFFHDIDHSLCSKPFAALICCDNMEDETPRNVVEYFKTFSRFMDAKQVGTIIRKSGKMIGYGKAPEREKAFPRVEEVFNAMSEAGKELATTGRITARTRRRTNASIIPMPSIAKFLMRFRFFKKNALPVMIASISKFSE